MRSKDISNLGRLPRSGSDRCARRAAALRAGLRDRRGVVGRQGFNNFSAGDVMVDHAVVSPKNFSSRGDQDGVGDRAGPFRIECRVEFSQLEGHPESAGIFGHEGTIADYLANQKIDDFVRASDLYFDQLQRLFDAWREAPVIAPPADQSDLNSGGSNPDDPMPDFLDADKAIADYCASNSQPEPTDLDARMSLHLAAIEQWLQRQSG